MRLDLASAKFNLREVAKQLILLEDHLVTPGKNCQDCIRKHRLAAEAFAEEALSLDGAGEYPWLPSLPDEIRAATSQQEIRVLRKSIIATAGLSGLGGGNMRYEVYRESRPYNAGPTATAYAFPAMGCYSTPSGQSIGGAKVPLGRPFDGLGRYSLGEAREEVPGVMKDASAPFVFPCPRSASAMS